MPKKGSEIVDVEVTLVHQTERAWKVTVDGTKEVWVPKSVGELEQTGPRLWVLTLPTYQAEDKGLV